MPQELTPPGRDDDTGRWGRGAVAGRGIRAWADLRNRRVVIQLDCPAPHYVGVVVAIAEDARPVLLLNPQHTWADIADVRSRLLEFAVDHYAAVRSSR